MGDWNPGQYHKFRRERSQPFWDLLALIQPRRPLFAIDLGCGTGELTQVLAERLDATVLGIDRSPAMLEQAQPLASRSLSFQKGDIYDLADVSPYDLVFSNAALQWVPDNEALLRRWLPQLRPGAQVALQVPKNTAHPSHTVAAALAQAPPYREHFAELPRSHALDAERYAELLYEHGLVEQVCFEKIYGHILESAAEVFEWARGTLLNAYLPVLPEPHAKRFLAEYHERLIAMLGSRTPYFYTYRRLLLWARKRA